VRPEHLFVGTNLDNVADMMAKKRQPRGESKTLAKLSEASVRAMRYGARAGFSIGMMAKIAGVSAKTVRDAVNGVTWRHVS